MSKPKSKKQNSRSKSWNDKESRDMKRDYKRKRSKDDNCDRTKDRRDSGDALSSLNDMSWYSRYPELLNSVSRLPFPSRPGRTLDVRMTHTAESGTDHERDIAVPGIMALNWAPSVGTSKDVLSPISIAGKEIYAKVRSKFSGSLSADAPDFIVYLGALDSIYSFVGWLKRLYKITTTYSPNNYALPNGLMASLGINDVHCTQIVKDKARLWNGINTLIRMTDKFIMPDIMDLFKRHYWMGENVYCDAPTINSQFYIFNQVWFYKFEMLPVVGNDSVSAGGLKMVARPGSHDLAFTDDPVGDLISFGEGLISALASNEDSYDISGYLMKAYEGNPVFTVTLQPLEEDIIPVYVEEVLTQIENSSTVCKNYAREYLSNFTGLDVQQDVVHNTLVSQPMIAYKSAEAWQTEDVLSIRSDDPSVENVVIATRLKAFVGKYNSDDKCPIICGTELPLDWNLWVANTTGVFNPLLVYTYSGFKQPNNMWFLMPVPHRYAFDCTVADSGTSTPMSISLATDKESSGLLVLLGLMYRSQFDWSPIAMGMVQAADSGTPSRNFSNVGYIVGDSHNITVVSTQQIQDIHRVAIYSEFNAFTE